MRARRRVRRTGLTALWAVLALVLGSCDQVPVPRGVLPYGAVWTRVRPTVVWCGDRQSTVTIEAHIASSVRVLSARVIGPNETIRLYDDGSHGDALAGDRVFTATSVRPYCHSRFTLRFGRSISTWYGRLEVTTADGETVEDPVPLRIGLVSPKYLLKSDVAIWGDGVSTTANAVFIHDASQSIFDGYPVTATAIDEALRRAARTAYDVLPDVFDFVLVMPAMPMYASGGAPEVTAASVRVSNAIERIGVALFDDTVAFGSSGRLQSAIYHSFGSLDLVDREIARRWGPDIGEPFGLVEESAEGCSCWSGMSDIGGHLAAATLIDGEIGRLGDPADGTWGFSPIPQVERYAPLELYLMGLIPPDDVPPAHVAGGASLSDRGRVAAESVRVVTIGDLVARAGGVRDLAMAADGTRPAFAVAFVVVGDEPFRDAEYAFYTLLSYALANEGPPLDGDLYSPFHWATGGRAALDTSLPFSPALDPDGSR